MRQRSDTRGPNLLDICPRQEADSDRNREGIVTLRRRRPSLHGGRWLGAWFHYLLAPPRIRLDTVGSFVWESMDGATSVGELSRRVRTEFGESAEPVEQRLGQFVRQLRRERFISYPGVDR